MSVKIPDLGPVSLPLTGTEQLEMVDSNGDTKRVSSADLSSSPALLATFLTVTANADLPNERILTAGANISIVDGGAGDPLTISASAPGGQVDSVVGGSNVNVNAADPANPIVNLDAALVGMSVNGVILDDSGVATNYLDETGVYSVPPGSVGAGTLAGSTLRYDGAQFVESLFLRTDDNEIITITNSFSDVFTMEFGVGGPAIIRFTGQTEFDIGDSEFTIGEVGGTGQFQIRYNGNLIRFETNESATLRFGTGTVALNLQLMDGNTFTFFEDGGVDPVDINNDGAYLVYNFDSALAGMRLNTSAVFSLQERAAAPGDTVGYGQIWVRDDTPNVLMYTDDLGTDFVISAGGGAQISGVPVNNQLAVWTDANTIEGESELVYNDGVLTMTYQFVNTSIEFNANNGNAIIALDGDEAGFGSVQLFFTSSDAGNGGVRFRLDANLGQFEIRQTNTSGGTPEDLWILFSRNAGLGLFFNGVQSLRTSDNGGADVGMGAEVLSGAGNFEPVGMNVSPFNLQNAAFMLGVGTPGDMIFHDEAPARVYTINNISGIKIGSEWGVINDAGSGDITFQAGAGVQITFWNGASWATTAVAGSVIAGEGKFTIYKRTDTQYYLNGPNLV